MNKRKPQVILYLSLSLFLPSFHYGQEYSCKNINYDFLRGALGEWVVETRDRTAPGEYEENEGVATISNAIPGCGIIISFKGKYKGNPYARESIITGIDSSRIQMVSMDSEHGGFLTYEGKMIDETLEVIWYRNKEKGKMMSKYTMSFENKDQFAFSSYLSTDYGASWALTHQRTFKRVYQSRFNFFAIIVKNMDKSIEWYKELLDFTIASRNRLDSKGIEIANLSSGKNRLELIEIESSVSATELLQINQRLQGLFKVGFSVNGLEPFLDKLKSLNPNFNESIVHDPVTGQRMIVLKDPDGNRIQLFENLIK